MGSIPKSSKKEPGHCFGLPTVQEAAASLGGDMLAYTDGGYFVLDVMVKATMNEDPIAYFGEICYTVP